MMNIKKKKILIINHTSQIGGSTVSFFDLLEMLKDEFEVFAGIPENSIKIQAFLIKRNFKYILFKSIPVYPYHSGGLPFFTPTLLRALFDFKSRINFANEINKVAPDVVILNSMAMCFSGPYINNEIRRICFVRETFKHLFPDKILKFYLSNYFDDVCFISNYDLNYCKNLKSNLHYIPDVDSNTKNRIPQLTKRDFNNKTILFMGGFDPIKGLDVLLKAIEYLNKPELKLMIIGNTDFNLLKTTSLLSYLNYKQLKYSYDVKKKLEKLASQVEVLGYQDRNSDIFKNVSLLVFPSTYQHQSRPAIEAGIQGVPVIITDFEATNEYFINNKNCLTFRNKDYIDLANKIDLLLNNKDLATKLMNENYLMSLEFHNFYSVKTSLTNIIKED